ncbi:MAG TPA: inner membrane CreD family protein, partial [Burkholderiaceae bacterium]
MRFPLLAKAAAIALVVAMVVACIARIEGLVAERSARGEEAVRGVEQSHAAAQVLLGPLLQRTCTEEWDTATDTDKGRVVSHD